jgi:stearoyl-CoA desaturase (delta-9 desaturase)
MWYNGFLDLSAWQVVGVTLLLTHITILSVTIYLHRYSAHRSLELNAGIKHFFRFWLWMTTGQNTREWTAIHRKHHAKCETVDDPHSPVVKGLGTVLRTGAELYRAEAENPDTLRIYGKNCPEDWLERNLYSRYKLGGIALMAIIDVALFGALGITVWAVQMMWIPFWAAGVVNGLGHAVGYRNFECRDAITPTPTRPSSRCANGNSTWVGCGFASSALYAWPRSSGPHRLPTASKARAIWTWTPPWPSSTTASRSWRSTASW